MIATAELIQKPTDEDIALQAYLLWEQHGYPHGRDKEFWYKAEERLFHRIEKETTRIEAEVREVKIKAGRRSSSETSSKTGEVATLTAKSKPAATQTKAKKQPATKKAAAKKTVSPVAKATEKPKATPKKPVAAKAKAKTAKAKTKATK